MQIFIVLHHEIMGGKANPCADEMMFYTASTLSKALHLIKKSSVDEWSWWEIQTQELNSHQWPQHLGYYGRRGGKLKRPPYDKCVALYRSRK